MQAMNIALLALALTMQDSLGAWRRLPPSGVPGRFITAAAFDSARGVVVLFGGDRMRSTPVGDTWELDGDTWRRVEAEGPAARYGHAMAYDPAGRQVLLFGGYDKVSHLFPETWAFDGSRWTRQADSSVTPRRSPGSAWDTRRGRWVVFGGNAWRGRGTEDVFRADTWEWDGRRWTLGAAAGPAPRYGGEMVYDAARSVTLLFGGNDHSGNIYGDTWTWDGRAWSRVAETGPEPRGGALLAYDPRSRSVLLFGGFARDVTYRDAWRWDGRGWQRIAGHAMPALIFPTLVHDTSRGRLLLIGQTTPGGEMETWELPLR